MPVYLEFIKKSFTDSSAAYNLSLNDGKVVFDSSSQLLWVGGLCYGSTIQDVIYDIDASVLHIQRVNHPDFQLHFNSIEDAEAQMRVFKELHDWLDNEDSSIADLKDKDEEIDSSITRINTALAGILKDGEEDDTVVNYVKEKIEALDSSDNEESGEVVTEVTEEDGIVSRKKRKLKLNGLPFAHVDSSTTELTIDGADVSIGTYEPVFYDSFPYLAQVITFNTITSDDTVYSATHKLDTKMSAIYKEVHKEEEYIDNLKNITDASFASFKETVDTSFFFMNEHDREQDSSINELSRHAATLDGQIVELMGVDSSLTLRTEKLDASIKDILEGDSSIDGKIARAIESINDSTPEDRGSVVTEVTQESAVVKRKTRKVFINDKVFEVVDAQDPDSSSYAGYLTLTLGGQDIIIGEYENPVYKENTAYSEDVQTIYTDDNLSVAINKLDKNIAITFNALIEDEESVMKAFSKIIYATGLNSDFTFQSHPDASTIFDAYSIDDALVKIDNKLKSINTDTSVLIDYIDEALDRIDSSFADVSTKLGNVDSSILDLKNEDSSLNDRIDTLSDKMDASFGDVDSSISDLNDYIETVDSSIRADVSNLEDALDTANQNIYDVSTNIVNICDDVSTLDTSLAELTDVVNQLDSSVDDKIDAKINELNENTTEENNTVITEVTESAGIISKKLRYIFINGKQFTIQNQTYPDTSVAGFFKVTINGEDLLLNEYTAPTYSPDFIYSESLQAVDADTSVNLAINKVDNNLALVIQAVAEDSSTFNFDITKIANAVGLDGSLNFIAHPDASYISTATSVDEALTLLDSQLGNIGDIAAADVSLLDASLKLTDSSLADVSTRLNTLNTFTEGVSSAVDALVPVVANQGDSIASLNERVNANNQNIGLISDHIDIMDASIATMDASIQALESGPTSVDSSIAKAIQALDSSVDENVGYIVTNIIEHEGVVTPSLREMVLNNKKFNFYSATDASDNRVVGGATMDIDAPDVSIKEYEAPTYELDTTIDSSLIPIDASYVVNEAIQNIDHKVAAVEKGILENEYTVAKAFEHVLDAYDRMDTSVAIVDSSISLMDASYAAMESSVGNLDTSVGSIDSSLALVMPLYTLIGSTRFDASTIMEDLDLMASSTIYVERPIGSTDDYFNFINIPYYDSSAIAHNYPGIERTIIFRSDIVDQLSTFLGLFSASDEGQTYLKRKCYYDDGTAVVECDLGNYPIGDMFAYGLHLLNGEMWITMYS